MLIARRLLACTIAASLAAAALAQTPAAPTPPAAPATPPVPAAPAKVDAPAKPAPAEAAKPAEKLPTPQEIQERFLKVTGGREAQEKIKARISTGPVEISPMGIKGTISIKALAPNKARMITEIDGIGKVDQGTDGKVAWELNPMTGGRLLDGDELAEFLRSTAMQTELKLFEAYPTSKTIGVEKVNDKDAFRVELTTPKADTVTRFYDKESGLLVKQSQTVKSQMGEITAEVFMEDYKDVGPIKVAHTNRTRFQNIEQKMTFTSIEFPATIPDEAFAPPAEVQQLIEDAAKAAKKPEADKPGDTKPATDKPAVDPKK